MANRNCSERSVIRWVVVVGIASVLRAVGTAGADTIFVNGGTGDDAWTGRCAIFDGGSCGPKKTIQAGIDAAAEGDEVVIADGHYTGVGNRNLTFRGKAIRVRSANGAAGCIVDAGSQFGHRGFVFEDQEGREAIVEGLTVQHGRVWEGGAIYCTDGSTPTIRGCVFVSNSGNYGGAIACDAAGAFIEDCIFHRQWAEWGGGVYLLDSFAEMTECVFYANDVGGIEYVPGGAGGAAFVDHGSTMFMSECLIVDNRAEGADAGVAAGVWSRGTLVMRRCTLSGNTQSAYGSLVVWGGQADFSELVIAENETFWGDAVITGNEAIIQFRNCSIRGNGYDNAMKGAGCDINFANCILLSGPDSSDGAVQLGYHSRAAVSHTMLDGGTAAFRLDATSSVTFGEGIIDSTPRVALPEDLRLYVGSVGVDAGTDATPGGLSATDRDGMPRSLDGDGINGSRPDVGAYEHVGHAPELAASPLVLYASVRAGDRTPVTRTIRIRNAGLGTLEWIIESPVAWIESVSGTSVGEIDDVLVKLDPAGLGHGYHTCRLTVRGVGIEREIAICVLFHVGGTIRVPTDFSTIQEAINACHDDDEVVIADGLYTGFGNTSLSPFGRSITIRSANGPRSCIIDCGGSGVAIFNNRFEPGMLIDGLTIQNSSSQLGAIIISSILETSVIQNCVVRNCSGSGVVAWDSIFVLRNCMIHDNHAGEHGGGVFANVSGRIENCTITGNSAVLAGGGIWTEGRLSDVTLVNSIIAGNYSAVGSELGIDHGILRSEYSDVVGVPGSVYLANGGQFIAGAGNIDGDPLFRDAANGDFRLSPASPCIDAGDQAFEFAAGDTDIVGLKRVWNGRVDMGAHEFASFAFGDLNCDGSLNQFDITPFLKAIDSGSDYPERHPGCDRALADLSEDGTVNVFDINAFVELLISR